MINVIRCITATSDGSVHAWTRYLWKLPWGEKVPGHYGSWWAPHDPNRFPWTWIDQNRSWWVRKPVIDISYKLHLPHLSWPTKLSINKGQLQIDNRKLPIPKCQFQIVNITLPIENLDLKILNCKIANCKMQIENRQLKIVNSKGPIPNCQ